MLTRIETAVSDCGVPGRNRRANENCYDGAGVYPYHESSEPPTAELINAGGEERRLLIRAGVRLV